METVLRMDMRGPAFGTPMPQLYRAALEMADYADQRGVEVIMLCEHHAAEDGYCPSPTVLAGAIAARTARARIRLACVILPLHNPIQLAEQILVADHVSNGRIEVVAAAGYIASEFAMFGQSIRQRPQLMDHGLHVLGEALAGRPVTVNEHTFTLTPAAVQRPRPPLIGAGGVPASARRAAKFCDGFFPMTMDPELCEHYRSSCRDFDRPVGPIINNMGPMFVHVTEDPERDWDTIGPHALHEINSYGRWAAESSGGDLHHPYKSVENITAARASGMYAVVTPEECLDLMARSDEAGHSLVLTPLLSGLSPDISWPSLTLFFEQVLPRYKAANQATTDLSTAPGSSTMKSQRRP
jgi:alkanesulfonate monooxygenase SsuD/methylene tetrahydromethanopterin reductase-like flavin-dependent oxidoreductase (luciferase family)